MFSIIFRHQFCFHDKSFDKLHEMVGRQCLPEQYDRLSESTIDQQYSVEFLREREAWFNYNVMQKYGYIGSGESTHRDDAGG